MAAAARTIENDDGPSDRLFVHADFAGIREGHLAVFVHSGKQRPSFVDHCIRLVRAARQSQNSVVLLVVVERPAGLPDPGSRQRYVDLLASLVGEAVGAVFVTEGEGFPKDAHKMVLEQVNDPRRHGLPTNATDTLEGAIEWLTEQGASAAETTRLVALVTDLRAKQRALADESSNS